jgi:hypothetical protein
MDMANRIQEAIKDILAEGAPVVKESAPGDVEYDIEDIGIEHPQYFSGAGVAYTDWEDVFVGAGDDAEGALLEALDWATDAGWDVEFIDVDEEVAKMGKDNAVDFGEEMLYHVVLRLRHKD